MEELNAFKDKHLKEIEMRKDEVDHQLVITESYSRYCQEMKDKGSACDISLVANDLHVRAEELVKTQIHEDVALSKVEFLFTPSQMMNNAKSLIGELAIYGKLIDEFYVLE